MKCTFEGSNARVIAKAIQSLSKVGKELYVEVDQNGLLLRAINATHSAVGSIRFKRSMFETFNLPRTGNADFYCKISMKPCLAAFRSMKQVEHCELSITDNQTKFQVKLRCKLETVRQSVIAILDEQNITAGVLPDHSANVIRGEYKLFMEISNSFNAAEEELTLEAKSDSLAAKNYIEGARVSDRFMRSQLKLKPNEFTSYNVTQDTVITFCLKEFRAFLLFAESLSADMTLEFDEPGSPFFLKIKKHDDIECLLIMSTLSPDDVSFSEDYCQRELTVQDAASPVNVSKKRKGSAPTEQIEHKRRLADDTTLSTTSTDLALFQYNGLRTTPTNISEPSSVQPARLLPEGDTVDVDDDEEALILAAAVAVESSQTMPTANELLSYNSQEAPPMTVLAVQEDGSDEDCVPQSPEHRDNVRAIFSRCFQKTYVPREPSPSSQMYAPNSDTED
ncbi:cell cycle checkpoint control protein RAD9A [Scaptodrosophila lebanonensis]|uniref:Cell cycle checkpoint control protein RAD9A n=1 Tax=Drosophila lebanonensis TaxID=7225 RepID=A0A6J2TDF0_DROLE|nr:cell cycle checkpoint control protein RAD9A [Scaptodrosophila lebanonensis]